MAVIEAAAVERLTARDVMDALCLSREANWNQTRDDWLLFLESGTVFGLRDEAGMLIATAALLPSPPVTWISMVLVTEKWRRRGLAARLMQQCLDEARNRKLEPWLDATPAGAAVYGLLGFRETGFSLQRWRRTHDGSSRGASAIPSAAAERFLSLDGDAMRFDRRSHLRHLAERAGSTILGGDDAVTILREGDRARHIGPLIASGEARAVELIENVAAATTGPLLIDVAASRTDVLRCVEQLGFVFERPFCRMVYGASVVASPSEALMAVAGPEFG